MLDNMSDTQTESGDKAVNLKYLFFTFLKIGTVSFGGNMALVSMVQNIMVERDKTLDNEVILEAASIGSLLPGPLAVNIVTYIGYRLKKTAGAVISMIAILLPAVIGILVLSWLYFRFGLNEKFTEVMTYITGGVIALILATAWQFFDKELKGNRIKMILAVVGALGILFTKNFAATILLFVLGGLCGWILKLNEGRTGNIRNRNESGKEVRKRDYKTSFAWLILAVLLILFLSRSYTWTHILSIKIAIIFSGISLSLFGGGYVMIPIMQSLFVNELHWLSSQEFVDAIAFSQLTPGPILVSATFIGFKLQGMGGALLATLSIFSPSALLMILVSKIFGRINQISCVKNILSGIKAIVIGLVAGSAAKIGLLVTWDAYLIILTVVSLIMLYFYKISPVFIILSCALVGIVLWYFNIR